MNNFTGRMSLKRKIIIGIALTLALVLCVLGFVGYSYFKTPNFNTDGKTSYIRIYPNTTFSVLTAMLADSAGCVNRNSFGIVSKAMKFGDNIKTGLYKVTPNMSNMDMVRMLRGGHQEPVRFTFNNVRLKEDFVRRVSEQLMINADSLLPFINDSTCCAALGFTTETVLTMFLPNTYEMYWNVSEEKFISRMKREYDNFWNSDRIAKAQAVGLNPIEVSVLASIVEEESTAVEEYPMIAGLYLNRLSKGMPLQADPTVKFAVGDFGLRRILHKHLDVDSPYNTYKNIGLPPGPLRIPSIKAIEAVLNRSNHNYLYMCAKEDLSGTHNFAVTLAQHTANARRYQAALNSRGIK
jgi:UPF0755 protein